MAADEIFLHLLSKVMDAGYKVGQILFHPEKWIILTPYLAVACIISIVGLFVSIFIEQKKKRKKG